MLAFILLAFVIWIAAEPGNRFSSYWALVKPDLSGAVAQRESLQTQRQDLNLQIKEVKAAPQQSSGGSGSSAAADAGAAVGMAAMAAAFL